jgi:hypothetical protein
MLIVLTMATSAADKNRFAKPPMPEMRVDAKGFKADEGSIRAVCASAGRELWRHFPDYKVEQIVVQHGADGPIVWFRRNQRQEIVMRLNCTNTYWSQYAYQFAHEFCHILCGFEEDYGGNRWFEESLCETASLYALRAMARSWKSDPPYKNWRDYRDSLRGYVDGVMLGRDKVQGIYAKGMAAFYQTHAEHLKQNATDRSLNGAMAIVLLQLFEEKPERWESVRWLNSSPSPEGETFAQYLSKWHGAAPQKHKTFVKHLATLYGQSIE